MFLRRMNNLDCDITKTVLEPLFQESNLKLLLIHHIFPKMEVLVAMLSEKMEATCTHLLMSSSLSSTSGATMEVFGFIQHLFLDISALVAFGQHLNTLEDYKVNCQYIFKFLQNCS